MTARQINKSAPNSLFIDAALSGLIILLLHIIFAFISNKHIFDFNSYNSYIVQADSWLNGRLDVDYRSWLELAVYNGQYFVSFPPFPSYVLLPFTFLLGDNSDSLAALLSMLVGAVFAAKICHHFSIKGFKAVALTTFLYLGTNMWQITVDAWVWFIAQNFSVTLTLMAIFFALNNKKGSSLFSLACAVGCRPFQIIYLPVLVYLMCRNESGTITQRGKKLLFNKSYVFIPALLMGISYMVLNYLRFDSFFEFGHNYLPEFAEATQGQFSLGYVPQNFYSLFRLPTVNDVGIIDIPKFDGMNIFLVIPLFVLYPVFAAYNFVKHGRDKDFGLHIIGFSVICLHIFMLLMHKTMGGFHFGNRYILDTVPMLFVLTALSASKIKRDGIFLLPTWFLTMIGLAVNFYGTWQCYAHRTP